MIIISLNFELSDFHKSELWYRVHIYDEFVMKIANLLVREIAFEGPPGSSYASVHRLQYTERQFGSKPCDDASVALIRL